jgi:4-amino-4-deoxy-L-arabinose transferase-like glycosyltransferase
VVGKGIIGPRSWSHRVFFSVPSLRYAAILVPALLGWMLFFYHLADRDLWSSHEGRAAQDAQTIINENRWGLPRLFDQKLELQKPPLYYWLVALTAKCRDGKVDAWSVRLPAAVAGLAGVLCLYGFGLSRRRAMAGWVGALVLATAVHYTWLARTGRIDMPLTLAISVVLVSFFLGQCRLREQGGRGGWPWFLTAYAGTAAAILLKGPIGVVLPAAVAGMYLLTEGELAAPWKWRVWLRLWHQYGLWWGIPLICGLTAPWFIWAGIQTNGSLFRTFFLYHNLDRAFGGFGGLRAHPWYLYGAYLAVELLPWSPLLLLGGWIYWRRGWWREDAEARFGLVWLVTMVAILSLARFKRADYLLPAFPGAALFLGCAAERWWSRGQQRRWPAAAFGVVIMGCVAGWWVYLNLVLPGQEPAREYRRFAAAIRRQVPAPELVLFFRTEAHALAFHVGEPIDTFLEWENLDIWAGRPGCHYIVMPVECAEEYPQHVSSGRLEEVARSTEFAGAEKRQRPLVLLKTRPGIVAKPDSSTGILADTPR